MRRHWISILLLGAATASLSACGGGGGGANSTPFVPPPPPPPPPPTTCPPDCTPDIVEKPQVGDYVTAGVAVQAGLYSGPLGTISSADSDQPQIRLTADGTYEIKFPDNNWLPYSSKPDIDVFWNGAAAKDYEYSALAKWFDGWGGRFGYFAVGVPTPASGVPTSGTASYHGTVYGTSDVEEYNYFDPPHRASVSGSVDLNFDFGQGSLAGAMTLLLGSTPIPLGSFSFKDTVFSVGSTSYSGKFDTSATGQNYFLGYFAGPDAQETVGAWALPFILTSGSGVIKADNQPHQAFGAWIAKGP